ncbi:MAG: hypothetical protein OHK0022_47580 [Roseiflexaceae bacterium]
MATQAHVTVTEHDSSERGAGLWLRWMLATALGFALGLAAPVLAEVITSRSLVQFDDPVALLLMLAVYLFAAALEGMVLGTMQWLVLRRALPAVRWRQWVGVTAMGTMVAWCLGLMPAIQPYFVSLPFDLSLWLLPVCMLASLVAVGVAQWVVLRRQVARAWSWIYASLCSRAFGISLLFLFRGMQVLPDSDLLWLAPHTYGVSEFFLNSGLSGNAGPIELTLLLGLITSSVLGLLAGAITGFALVRLLRQSVPNQAVQQP